jgi:hypothetical protein
MKLQNDRQLANTEAKLKLIEEQIAVAQARPASPENDQSIDGLATFGDQLRAEIEEYKSAQKPTPVKN